MALYIKWQRFDEERIEQDMPEQRTGYEIYMHVQYVHVLRI